MYHALNVGIGGTVGVGQLVIGVGLLAALRERRADRAGHRGQFGGNLRAASESSEKSKGPVTSNCSTGVRSIEQLQELNLGGAQIDDGCLNLRFVLHAEQFDAVEVDLRQCRRLESGRG